MGLIQRILGTAPSDWPSIAGTNKKTPDEVDQLISDYTQDINRQNLISLGRDFSPDDVRNFRYRARYNDPRYLYAMYDEIQRLGPTAQRMIAIEALKSASPQFVTRPEQYNDDTVMPEDADPRDVEAARAARDFIEDTISPVFDELIELMADEFFYGISNQKVVLEPRGNAGRFDSISYLESIPARRHRLDPITQDWMLMLSPDSWEGQKVSDLTLRTDSGTEGIFFCELDPSTPLDQRGLYFKILVPWGIEQYGWRWYAKYVELFGVPPRYAKVDFAYPNRVQEAKQGLKQMGSTAYGVFNIGTELSLLEAHNGGSMNPFETLLEKCARRYDEVILGHSQTTGVQRGVGGKMSADTAQEQFRDLTNSRLKTLARQLGPFTKTLVARNLGQDIADRHNPIIRLRYVPRDDPNELAQTALILKNAGAGEKIETEDLVRRCAFKLAEPGSDNLGPPAAAAGPVAAAVANQPGDGGDAGATDHTAEIEDVEGAEKQAARAMLDRQLTEVMAAASPLKGQHVYDEIRKVIAEYQQYERQRALSYARRRLLGS